MSNRMQGNGMPDLRRDPVLGRWVIISAERGKRPTDFPRIIARRSSKKSCPFCVGNEDKTPPEVFAIRDPKTENDSPGWTVRVVPNKFPALASDCKLVRRPEGIYDKMSGCGAHEVIIETTEHDTELSRLPVPGVENLLWAIRNRIQTHKADNRYRYVLVFKNSGFAAGATLEHPHTQLIATPIVPKRVLEELAGCRNHFAQKERCIFCDIIEQETDSGESRLVARNDAAIAIEPFAPRFPFETWILPNHHHSSFEDTEEEEYPLIAQIIRDTLYRLDVVLDSPSYNMILHTAPCQESDLEYYHWHIEIMPKLIHVAGFEWGSGFYINPTSPEEAAMHLRGADIRSGGNRKKKTAAK